jgi:acetyltransferase-like isoleucine patch superfamily enzyme
MKITLLLKYLYSFIQSKTGYKKFGKGSIIKYPNRIWNKSNIEIGDNVFIAENSFFAASVIFQDQKFNPLIKIGNNVSIGGNLIIGCVDSVVIEDDVLIADRVFISDHIHDYENVKIPIINQKLKSKGGVLIKRGSFIGVNSVIMPGVIVGKNSVIGASSVVTKSVPDYSIVAGIPAKIIKKYDTKLGKWIKVKTR